MLLDTNSYLRLAKRIRPLLGKKFGQREYELTILKQVEQEVRRSSRLKFHFPWFENDDVARERMAKKVRLHDQERRQIEAACSVLRNHVLENAKDYTVKQRSPPGVTDCYILAFGQIRPAIVVTDDLGMHQLADEFELPVWHGHELLHKMLGAKVVDKTLVLEIYEALELNGDLPSTWKAVKHTNFKKVFGPGQ